MKNKNKSRKRRAAVLDNAPAPSKRKVEVFDADVKASNKRFNTLGRKQRKQYGDIARKHLAPTAPPFNFTGTETGRIVASPIPGTVGMRLNTRETVEIIMEAQRRFISGFNIYFGEAMSAAWSRTMLECPVQPGPCNRSDLVHFSNWFQGDNRTRFDSVLNAEINRTIGRIENEIIRDMAAVELAEAATELANCGPDAH